MDWGSAVENVNWAAVAVAAAVPFVPGFFWYSKSMFMTPWLKGVGMKEKDVNDVQGSQMAGIMVTNYVVNLVAATVMALLMDGTDGIEDGALFGAVVGLGIAGTSRAMHYLFERRTLTLFAINAGFDVLSLTLMGAVLGWMA